VDRGEAVPLARSVMLPQALQKDTYFDENTEVRITKRGPYEPSKRRR